MTMYLDDHNYGLFTHPNTTGADVSRFYGAYLLPYIGGSVDSFNALACPSRSLESSTDAFSKASGSDTYRYTYAANHPQRTTDYYGIWKAVYSTWDDKTLMPRALTEIQTPSVTMLLIDSCHFSVTRESPQHSPTITKNWHSGKVNYLTLSGSVSTDAFPKQGEYYSGDADTPDWWKIKPTP